MHLKHQVSGHNGHRPKRPKTETATNRNGHKPKRPQTETATNHICIPLLARYSDRCRIDVELMQFCGLDDGIPLPKRRRAVDVGIDISFLHQQSRLKYAILISVRYQHSDVGPI